MGRYFDASSLKEAHAQLGRHRQSNVPVGKSSRGKRGGRYDFIPLQSGRELHQWGGTSCGFWNNLVTTLKPFLRKMVAYLDGFQTPH